MGILWHVNEARPLIVNATWVQDFCGSYWGRGALSAGVAELVGGNPGAASNHVSSQGTLDWLETEEEMESWRHSWRRWVRQAQG